MNSTETLDIEKIGAIGEEIEASFNFIKEGIRSLDNQNSAVSSNHIPLQLLASGFERLVKILLVLKEKHLTGKYPKTEGKKNYFGQFDNGHGIKKMVNNLISYSEDIELMNKIPMVIEDLDYLKNDTRFNTFLEIITDFSKFQRYYYIDTIVKKERPENNSFEKFKTLIDSYSNDIDISKLTYDEEEEFVLNSTIITIEKGVRAISRFFTHGLEDEGRKHYGDFGSFILLRDEDLGRLKYLIPKINPQKDYSPWKSHNLEYLRIKTTAKSKIVNSTEHDSWPFLVKNVEVINYKNGSYCLVKIGKEIFALNGSAVSQFKLPIYHASKQVKPREYETYLLGIAQNL
ncbi:MAG: hypothetical protein COA97_13385 [Flavobacteriales bacterium]|nr:MAG: hypothetical protein COA97_13385 [Flavobacteriales bacterium]